MKVWSTTMIIKNKKFIKIKNKLIEKNWKINRQKLNYEIEKIYLFIYIYLLFTFSYINKKNLISYNL